MEESIDQMVQRNAKELGATSELRARWFKHPKEKIYFVQVYCVGA